VLPFCPFFLAFSFLGGGPSSRKGFGFGFAFGFFVCPPAPFLRFLCRPSRLSDFQVMSFFSPLVFGVCTLMDCCQKESHVMSARVWVFIYVGFVFILQGLLSKSPGDKKATNGSNKI